MKQQEQDPPSSRPRYVIPMRELLFLLCLGVAVFLLSSRYDVLEEFVQYSRIHEQWNLDEILIALSALFVVALIYFFRQWQKSVKAEQELAHRNKGLQNALAEIRQLRGILPICSGCKKIRDDQGYWHQVEAYFLEHSDLEFSHSLCPDCVRKLYPDLYETGLAAGVEPGP